MRGVVVHFGVAEMDETKEIYLVQFENGPDGNLGHPVGCLPDELTQNAQP
jgi:nitrogen fixation protein NifZ